MALFGRNQKPIFTLEIVYKSGHVRQFKVNKYTFTKQGTAVSLEWTRADKSVKPVHLNLDEVESIWEV